MTALILAFCLAAGPGDIPQPNFQCGAEDAACWRRMVLWEYNARVAVTEQKSDLQRDLEREKAHPTNSRFGWGFAAGLGIAAALVIGGIILAH
jgi:hypothetical protein